MVVIYFAEQAVILLNHSWAFFMLIQKYWRLPICVKFFCSSEWTISKTAQMAAAFLSAYIP
jgi:hypothetical protein